MKKILLLLVLVYELFANEKNFIEIGGGYIVGKNNFSTNSKKTITSYKSAKNQNKVIPNIRFNIVKKINTISTIYTTMEFGYLSIGSKFNTNNGIFDIGIKQDLFREAWENPYLLNSQRIKTKTQEIGGYFKYGIQLSRSYIVNLGYTYSNVNYDNETVSKKLKQEGEKHKTLLRNMFVINKQTKLFGIFSYEKYNADGYENNYYTTGISAGVMHKFNKTYELVFFTNLSNKKYEHMNSILDTKIKLTEYKILSSFKINKPVGFDNSYLKLSLGYEKQDANHDFYDGYRQLSMISIGYKF